MKGVYKLSEETKQQARDYREGFYAAQPQVKRFAQVRRALLWGLTGLLLAHEVLNGILIVLGLEDASYLPANGFRLLLHLFVLTMPRAMGGKGSLGLLIIVVPSVVTLVQSMPYAPFVFSAASPSPLLAVLFSVETVYTLLVLGVFVWLVLPPSFRLADREREIYLTYCKFINDQIPPEFRT